MHGRVGTPPAIVLTYRVFLGMCWGSVTDAKMYLPMLDRMTTVVLVDPPQGLKKGTPAAPSMTSECLSVVATSPHAANTADVKESNTKFVYVPMMSEREAREFLERLFPGHPDIVRARMEKFTVCGGSPRDLMNDAKIEELLEDLGTAVTSYDVDRLLAWSQCEVKAIGPGQASHKFVQIIPTHNYTKFMVWPLTAITLDVMLRRIMQTSSDRWLAALNPTANVGNFDRILAGWLFEAYAHARASDATLDAEFRTYRFKALFDAQTVGYLHPSFTKITKAAEPLSKKVNGNTVLLEPIIGKDATHTYHRTDSDFPSIAAVIQRSGSNRGSLLLQMTIQLKHIIKVFGLAIALRLLQVLPRTLAALLCFCARVSHTTDCVGFPHPEEEFSKFCSSAKVDKHAKSPKRKRAEAEESAGGNEDSESKAEPSFATTDFQEGVSTGVWPTRYITPSDRFTHLVTVVPDTERYRDRVNRAQPFTCTGSAALPNHQWPAWLHDVRQWVLFLPIDDDVSANCELVYTVELVLRTSDSCVTLLPCCAMVQTGSPKLRFRTFTTLPRPGIATLKSRQRHRTAFAFATVLALLLLLVLTLW